AYCPLMVAALRSGAYLAAALTSRGPLQPQLAGDALHCVNDELYMVRQIDAKIGRTALDIFPFHAAGEPFRLHFLQDTRVSQIANPGGAQQSRGRNEAGEFIARI